MTEKTRKWREWYKANKERRDRYKKKYDKAYHQKNVTKKRLAAATWRKAHPDRVRSSASSYYIAHRDELIQRATLRQRNNPSRAHRYTAKWRRNNPAKAAFLSRRNKQLRRHAHGTHTWQEWQTLKATHDFRCLACGGREPKIILTEDHVIPISRGGSDSIDNIQPLCKSCNCKKFLNTTDYRISPVAV